MMDMNALILAADLQVHAVGRVEDPADVAAFLAELRAQLLQHPAPERQRLYALLSGILNEQDDA